MKNWQRNIDSGVWEWEGDNGNLWVVPCDKNGWIDRENSYKAPRDQRLLYCWGDGEIAIDSGYDLSEPAIEGLKGIIGWQPLIPPMATKE